eukprot:evm.model.scf_1.12 EVM.evm.TU.scf_1.12   scf_1:238697-254881(+)
MVGGHWTNLQFAPSVAGARPLLARGPWPSTQTSRADSRGGSCSMPKRKQAPQERASGQGDVREMLQAQRRRHNTQLGLPDAQQDPSPLPAGGYHLATKWEDYKERASTATPNCPRLLKNGAAFVAAFEQHMCMEGVGVGSARDHVNNLMSVVLNSTLHPELSLRAARAFHTMLEKNPPSGVDDYWNPVNGNLEMLDINGKMKMMKGASILFSAISTVYSAVQSCDIHKHLGCVLLLEGLVALFAVDLSPRLAVIEQRTDLSSEAQVQHLAGCFLWRTLEDRKFEGYDSKQSEKHDMLLRIMLIMSVSGEDSEAEGGSGGQGLETHIRMRPVVGKTAEKLMHLLLSLYGTAEEHGLYMSKKKHALVRQFGNSRAQIDKIMLQALFESSGLKKDVGYGVFKTFKRKNAVLMALPHKDRMRLLGLVVGKRSFVEKSTYPGLWAAMDFHDAPCDYPPVAAEVPVDEMVDICATQFTCNVRSLVADLEEDGFCLLVAAVVATACALPQYKGQLPKVRSLFANIQELIASRQERLKSQERLSLEARIALRSANQLIKLRTAACD